MNFMDTPYDSNARQQITCMGVVAGFHLLFLLWNPILIHTLIHSFTLPKEKSPFEIVFLDSPILIPAPAPTPMPKPTPTRHLPEVRSVPVAHPPLLSRPFTGMPRMSPRLIPKEDVLSALPSAPIALVKEKTADLIHLPAAPLIQSRHALNALPSQGFPIENLKELQAPMRIPTSIPTQTSDDVTLSRPGPSSKALPPIDGPLSNRQVLHSVLPRYPAWAEEQGVVGMVRLRFALTPAGAVRPSIQVLRTSGYDALDRQAIEALRQWLFSPDAASADERRQWGMITFTFTLTKN